MPAGRYRFLVYIQRNTPSTSTSSTSFGEAADVWRTILADVPANIDTGSSREFWAAKQRHDELTHRVMIRWTSRLTRSDELRLLIDGSTSRILMPIGPMIEGGKSNRREIEFHCVEQV